MSCICCCLPPTIALDWPIDRQIFFTCAHSSSFCWQWVLRLVRNSPYLHWEKNCSRGSQKWASMSLKAALLIRMILASPECTAAVQERCFSWKRVYSPKSEPQPTQQTIWGEFWLSSLEIRTSPSTRKYRVSLVGSPWLKRVSLLQQCFSWVFSSRQPSSFRLKLLKRAVFTSILRVILFCRQIFMASQQALWWMASRKVSSLHWTSPSLMTWNSSTLSTNSPLPLVSLFPSTLLTTSPLITLQRYSSLVLGVSRYSPGAHCRTPKALAKRRSTLRSFWNSGKMFSSLRTLAVASQSSWVRSWGGFSRERTKILKCSLSSMEMELEMTREEKRRVSLFRKLRKQPFLGEVSWSASVSCQRGELSSICASILWNGGF